MSLSRTTAGFRFRDQNGSVIDFLAPEDVPAASILCEAASMELKLEGDAFCIYHWHDWKTGVEKLWFGDSPSGAFRLEKISPPSGFGLELNYDSDGRLSGVTQMIEGRRISFQYNERGLMSQLLVASPSSSARPFATYLYDQHDRLVEVRDATDTPIRYAYDRAGRMVREDTRSGAVFQMRYDVNGRCVSTLGTEGYHGCRLKYVLDGRVTMVTNSLGDVTAYDLNGSGQVVREKRPNGAVHSTRYDVLGRIVEEEGPLGGVTRYRYDTNSNTASVTYASGMTMEGRYNSDHQPILIRQGRSTWRFTYEEGQLVSLIDPMGVERRYGYDERGFLNSRVEPSGNTVRISADDGWARVRVVDDYGLEHEEYYDDLMNVTQRTEPGGGVFRFDSDVVGRLVRATAPGSQPREYRYDLGGQLAMVRDADGFTTHLRHNEHGLIEEVLTPTGRKYKCVWDTEGRLKAWVNPAGERAEFEHDAAGNEIEVRNFDGRVETSEFDIAGRRTRRHLADGSAIGFDYDVSDKLLRVHADGLELVANEYDVEGRLLRSRTPDTAISFEYDLGSRIVAEIQNGRRIDFAYNAGGMIITRTFSGSPLPPLEFEWDQRNRLVSLQRGGTRVQTLSYDAKDQCVERRFGNCAERFDYDISGKLVAQTVVREDGTLVARTWTHDGRGNVVGMEDRRSGEKRYQFDGDHHLVQSWTNGVGTDYSYDVCGNLISLRGRSQSVTFEYLSGNRLTRSGTRVYERDANGNVTRIVEGDAATSLSWNVLGQLVEVGLADGSRIKYFYDGLGRRLLRDRDGATTGFVWAGEQLLAQIVAQGTTEYLFGEFNPTTTWRGTQISYLVNSHLGVPLERMSEWGRVAWFQVLDDWGNLEYADGEADGRIAFRFPGQYADEDDGPYYNRFRYYDPKACQYLSPDPKGLAAGANEYIYCPNPVNWIDPFGLSCGIPPGQHSVYVLEKGPPPVPPTVIYVGITMQSPHARLGQHQNDPPGGVTPDQMRIIATGPPTVPDRTSARLIEASILTNAPQPGQPGALNNAERPVNTGTYYHSNVPSAAPPGTTHLPASTTNGLLSPTNGTVIK